MSDLLPRIQKVPSIPALYFRLLQILETGQPNLEEVGNIMAEDLAVTAKLLQMVNSPFFGLQRTVKSPVEAVAHLGLSQTRALVLLAHAFSGYNAQKDSKFSLERLWQHSTSTAKLARTIIEAETADAAQAELAFTAGLLHDVGKLFHAANCPKEYNTLLSQAERNDMLYVDVERHLVGTTHAELGACVLATWGLPAEILEVIAFHHAPGRLLSNSFGPLTAVHVANAFEHELNSELTTLGFLDHEYLKRVGCESRLALWIERCCAAPLPLAA
jgi:putative nucleotidyltransferase with HDIG domain